MSYAACFAARRAYYAEMALRRTLRESRRDLSLGDAASLGNIITSLVRWRHLHATRCQYCENARAAKEQNA